MLDPTKPETKARNLILDAGTPVNASNNPIDVYSEAEYIPLATKGIYFPGHLKGIDKIKVRKLNWQDENLLATQSYYENGTIFQELLKATIVDDQISSDDLTAIDREVIILWLRMTALGTSYEVPYKCSNILTSSKPCNHKQTRVWDLNSFEMPAYSKEITDILESNDGCYPVELKSIGKTVYLKYPTYGKEEAVYKALVESVPSNPQYVTTKYVSWIAKVEGLEMNKEISSWRQIESWLSSAKFSIQDSRLLKKKINELSLEIKTEKTFKCSKCNHIEEDVTLPITINFLWPE